MSRFAVLYGVAAAAVLSPCLESAHAQPPAAAPGAAEGRPAVIERAPLTIRDPLTYQVPLRLDPVRRVEIAAVASGTIGTVMVKVGDTVRAQSEVARLDTRERQLEFARAQAAYKAAQEEHRTVAASEAAASAARVEVAKADLDLAQLRLDRCGLPSPLAGMVTAVHVVPGQFVQAGQPVVTVIDPTSLRVELPVDARSVASGAALQLKVEDQTVPATVQAVLPIDERFEPLRDLFLSVGLAVAVVDNAGGKLRAGQTVYSEMIPRLPVAEVPNAAVSNAGDGERKVQVLRDGFVRDVKVQLLGQVGEDHVFVSGRFGPADELVIKSSERLLDGARVVPHVAGGAGAAAPKAPGTPAAQPTGF